MNDGDRLNHHSTDEVGGTEADDDEVESLAEQLLLVLDGCDDHEIEDNADYGKEHINDHNKGTLIHQTEVEAAVAAVKTLISFFSVRILPHFINPKNTIVHIILY